MEKSFLLFLPRLKDTSCLHLKTPIAKPAAGGGEQDIGEVLVSSVYDVPCMYVRMFVILDGM